DNLTFQTNTDMQLRMLAESTGIVMKDKHVVKLLEKEIEKEMERRFNKLLAKLQKWNADGFGYGRYYKSTVQGQNLSRKEWRDKFPDIEVDFNVNVKLLRRGVQE